MSKAPARRASNPEGDGNNDHGSPPQAVDRQTLETAFSLACQAPSNCNTQPWQVYVASGETLARLRQRLPEALAEGDYSMDFEYTGQYDGVYKERQYDAAAQLERFIGALTYLANECDEDLDALEAVRLPLARVAEIYALRRIATTLLDEHLEPFACPPVPAEWHRHDVQHDGPRFLEQAAGLAEPPAVRRRDPR